MEYFPGACATFRRSHRFVAGRGELVFEEFGRPAHTYAPVYTDRNIEEILDCSDHITFNSVAQFERFGQMALLRGISCGLRINPGYSPVETDLYNPCVPGSRLGIPAGELKELPAGVEGLHFHVLCESAPNICAWRSMPSKSVSVVSSTGSNGSIWAADTL